MHAYNNSKHRSIKMKPVEVNKSNRFKVWMNLHSKDLKTIQPKLTLGDMVRITKAKGAFEKGYHYYNVFIYFYFQLNK